MSEFLCTVSKPLLFLEGEGAASSGGSAALVRTRTVQKKSPYATILGWTRYTTGLPTNGVVAGAFFKGMFVVVSQSSVGYATSTDGVTWTNRSAPSTIYAERCAASPTALILPTGGSGTFLRTTDGINWTQPATNANYSNLSVCYGNGVFVASCWSAGLSSNKFAYSTNDGVTWALSAKTFPAGDEWARPAWNGRVFCTIRYSTGEAYVSTDGSNWTVAGKIPVVGIWGLAANSAGRLVCVYSGSGSSYYSDNDGQTWSVGASSGLTGVNYLECANDWFVATSSASTNVAYFSRDGITWRTVTFTNNATRLVCLYGNNRYLMPDNAQTEICVSSDTFFRSPSDPLLVGSSFSYVE